MSYLTPLFPGSLGGKAKAMSPFQGLNKCWNYRLQVTSFLCPQPEPRNTHTGPSSACFSRFFSA